MSKHHQVLGQGPPGALPSKYHCFCCGYCSPGHARPLHTGLLHQAFSHLVRLLTHGPARSSPPCPRSPILSFSSALDSFLLLLLGPCKPSPTTRLRAQHPVMYCLAPQQAPGEQVPKNMYGNEAPSASQWDRRPGCPNRRPLKCLPLELCLCPTILH